VECLRLPASAASIPQLRQLALDAAQRAGLGNEALQRVDLVLEEALANVIHHAYDQTSVAGADRLVELCCAPDPDGALRLTLKDWGAPFDPVAVAETAPELEASLEANMEADLDHRAPGGLGLFLIQTMSEASYARLDGSNVLSLRFTAKGPL